MDAKKIGQRLRKLREKFGWSKRYVAKSTGIAYRSICAYEYGERIPTDNVKIVLANFFGVTVEDLFFADNNHEMN